ncbi:MAG: sensor histidine kinase [Verrucomicrobiota bacterium]
MAGRLGWSVALIGGMILFGWVADLPLLRSLLPGQVEAKANTALCFVLTGVALGWQMRRRGLVWSKGAAAIAGLLALATLLQYPLGQNWGIDELLFKDVPGAVDTSHPGRMAPPTALNFVLLAAALLLPRRFAGVTAVLALAACGIAMLAFGGTLYDLPRLVRFGPHTAMAAPTGGGFLLLGLGVLLAGGTRLAAWTQRSARTLGFICTLLLLLLLAGAVVRNALLLVENSRQVARTHEALDRLAALLSALQDLETGTRGYLLTGNPAFLEPAEPAPAAARTALEELRALAPGDSTSAARLDRLERLSGDKVAVSRRQVALYGQGAADDARRSVAAGEGKRLMDAIRAEVAALQAEERRRLRERQTRVEDGTTRTLLALGAGLTASLAVLITVFLLLRREVAARTRLAAELRQSEESLAVTLNSIGDGVLATDTAGRITLLNPVAERLTGWPLAEARGRPVVEIFRIINEETRAPAPIPVAEVLATGEIKGLANHTALIARDGSERAIADSAAPIRDAEGRALGVVLVFRDVTETRKAQAQLDRFFELSLDFLCIAGQDGRFKRASPAVTDILGWTVEEFLAMPYMEQVHPEDRAATQREVERQMKEGEKVFHFENRYRHKDGSWRVLSWRSAPWGGFMYATARDVTEARQQEAQIRALNKVLHQHAAQLELANKELEAFSYSVSHDLRAPLRHVLGYVEMLSRETQGALPEKAQRYLRTIAEAAREMGALIDDLLAFSRMGRAEMRETEVDPGPLVEEVRRALAPDMTGREIRWTIAPLPRVRADAAMLRQVFVNLLGNAVKYTRRRDVAEITVGCAGEEEGRVVFCVRDNGAGFDMKYADKLFGVFQRLHRADEFEGTGIGLASVRRIISRHGGRTWAEARVNEGATFYFTLQAAPATPAPPSSAPAHP